MRSGRMRAATPNNAFRKVRSTVARPKLEVASPRTASRSYTDSMLATSHAEIALRQSFGTGLPVLLLHGASSSRAVFDRQIGSALGQEYRLIALDLPGHGDSGDAFDPDGSYSVPAFADLAVEVLEQLGIEQVVVVGWSLGGHVGLELMSLFPGLVGLMISGTAPLGRSPAGVRTAYGPHNPFAGTEDLTGTEADAFLAATLGSARTPELDQAAARADPAARRLLRINLIDGKLSDERRIVETSEVPLALVNGAEDPVVDLPYLTGLNYANLWNRKCYLVPQAGHAPCLETPAVFNHLLRQFLRRMEARAKAQLDNPPLCLSG